MFIPVQTKKEKHIYKIMQLILNKVSIKTRKLYLFCLLLYFAKREKQYEICLPKQTPVDVDLTYSQVINN